MDAERLQQIQKLFDAALEHSPEDREDFLKTSCRGDPELRAAIERYLLAHSGDFTLLDEPVSHVKDLDALVEAASTLEGRQVGSYRILRLLGRGGMGVVYLAHDSKLERNVALKFLSPHLSADPQSKARFLTEARAAAALDNPYVATVHEVGETEAGLMFIAMTYYPGETLKQKIEKGHLPIEEALEITRQVAEGLAVAHQHGIVHRDVKTANILLTTDGTVKIVDFGVAKVAGGDATATGNVMGTVAYMSPEQVQGKGVDHRTDQWSLGVVLYQMLAGSQPFQGEDIQSTISSILLQTPDPLAHSVENVPKGLQAIVSRLLAKDPDSRYTDEAELIADLKLSAPDAISQRLEADPQGSRPTLPQYLPASLTTFIGREQEIEQVKTLLSRTRLLTLMGSGGSGKTRLALQVAAEVDHDFEDGVCFIGLAPITDPSLVGSTIARALNLREMGGVPIHERLITFLRDVRGLLLLDNFEQVVEAAPLVVSLLEACPGLKILVTSRAPLHVQGEQEFPVPPLVLPETGHLPSLEQLAEYEAVALFLERAKAVRPDFRLVDDNATTVAEVCVRLDGLPLAIELAASRIKLLPPRAILARLEHRFDLLTHGGREVPARHRTLREAIGWSHELLNKDEKKLFRRTAVFAGGHTVEAAAAVHSAGRGQETELLDSLSSLVDQNLIQQQEQDDGEPRFFRLETIREFSLECLRASGEEATVRRHHLDYCLDLAEQAEPFLTGPQQGTWLGRLAQEQDNLRVAMHFALEIDNHAACRLGRALWRFWLVHGHLNEGGEQLDQILTQADSSISAAIRAQLLTGAGTLAHNRGYYPAARSFFEESLTLYRERDDKQGIADTLNNLGWMAFRLGDYAPAWTLSEESLALHRELGQKRGTALALNNMGWLAHHQGDFSRARRLFQESLDLQQQRGDERGTAFALTSLAWATCEQDEAERALALLEQAQALFRRVGERQLLAFCSSRLAQAVYHLGDAEQALVFLKDTSLPIFRDINDQYGVALVLCIHGDVLWSQERYQEATESYQESLRIREEMGDKWGTAQSLCRLAEAAMEEDDLARALKLQKQSLILRRDLEDKAGIAECLRGLASAALHSNLPKKAAFLLGAAEALRQSIRGTLSPRDKAASERLLATLPKKLSRKAFSAARAGGSKMKLHDSIASVLNADDAI